MKSMYIGSGDVAALLSGKNTETHYNLLRRFVSGSIPFHNAKASPIDAFRIGAILEDRYMTILPDNYFPQYKCTCKSLDVLRCSIDFAKIENGNIVDFDELKTCNFTDYIDDFEPIKNDNQKMVDLIKSKHKSNYNQIQQQLLCSGLDSANLVYLAVYSYDDYENENRTIKENEYIKVRIQKDDEVINKIIDSALIFQQIKDYYSLTIK